MLKGHGQNMASQQTPSTSANQNPNSVMDRLRAKLKTRGANGLIGLARLFRNMDDNRSMSLDRDEFNKAMEEFGLGLSHGEIATLFGTFDINRDGAVDYNEFLREIRGPMNALRKQACMNAFNKMDRDRNGYLDYNDLVGVYSGKFHPEVKAGKKTEQQVLTEFLNTFQQHHNIRDSGTPDDVVTKEEFVEYYNNISANIDNDSYFMAMMNSAWNLDGSRVTKGGWSNSNPITGAGAGTGSKA